MRKGKNREIYIRFLLNALPILIIPLFLLFSAYFRNQKLFKQEIYDKNISILENSALMGESMMASVESIVNYLDESSSVNKFLNFYSLNEDGTNTNEVILLQKDINSLITANDAIDNIQIFSKNNKMLLDGTQVVINLNRYYDYTFSITGIDYDHWYHEMLMGIHNWNNRLQTLETTDKSITKQMFFFSSDIPANSGIYSSGCVFILLGQDKLFRYFDRLEYQKDGFVYLQDGDGNILCEDNRTGVENIYLPAEETSENSGFITKKIGGNDLFLTYYKDKNNWLYVCAVPRKLVMSAVQDTWGYFLFMLVFALGIGILLVHYFTTRLSAPITKIYDLLKTGKSAVSYDEFDEEIERLIQKNEQMQDELEKQIPALKTSIFHTLATGGYHTREEIEENLQKIQIAADSPLYLIIIVSLNDLDTGNNLEKIAAQKIYLKKIMEETFLTTQIYDLDFERIALLLESSCQEKQEAKQQCEQNLAYVKEKMENNSGISISFHGDAITDIGRIPSGFKHIRTLLDNEYESFKGIIQWYDEKNLVRKIREQETYDIKQRIRKHIEENYADPQLSLISVADSFGISEVYLSRLFKQSFEQNFSKYVEELRMNKAKELIEMDMYTVSDISGIVGYNSPQTFRRAYKRYFGCTPRER